MLNEKNSSFLISKQGNFRWNDLLNSFKEGDTKDFAEIQTGDLQMKTEKL
jgi:hypothetical protein